MPTGPFRFRRAITTPAPIIKSAASIVDTRRQPVASQPIETSAINRKVVQPTSRPPPEMYGAPAGPSKPTAAFFAFFKRSAELHATDAPPTHAFPSPAVSAPHHLDPHFASITGSTIVANATSQKNGPILPNTGSRGFRDFGVRIALHMTTKRTTPIHPAILNRCRDKLTAPSHAWQKGFGELHAKSMQSESDEKQCPKSNRCNHIPDAGPADRYYNRQWNCAQDPEQNHARFPRITCEPRPGT